MRLGFRVISHGAVEKQVFHRTLSLFPHPFLHRRELMAVWHRAYKWEASLAEHSMVKWADDVRDELLGACLLLPHAAAHLRWGRRRHKTRRRRARRSLRFGCKGRENSRMEGKQ